MGRKSEKGKDKKLKRKEEKEKLKLALQVVAAANQIDQPLRLLVPLFHSFKKNGLDVTILCKKTAELDENEIDIIFRLVKDNMESLYRDSSLGWNDKEKLDEMTHELSRYLLAKDENGSIVAMCHFRFDVDEDVEVLYCYEIQLLKDSRGKGLGKFMLQILELMAMKAKLKKVVLTVFKANEAALNFFTALKYINDDTSPRCIDAECPDLYDYEILSKSLVKH